MVRPKPAGVLLDCEPAFEVITMTVFSKLTNAALRVGQTAIIQNLQQREWGTSGCAFSISSNRTTEYGRRRIFSVS